jgi:glycosyltransferase involved in cell wall biosynthesis
VVVVGNWKDPADFEFTPGEIARARSELGIHNGELAVCYIANLGRERRIEPLLQAVGGDDRFVCVIGGDGPQADLVRQYASRHANIRYLGRVSPHDVSRITAACDVLYYGFDETNPNARWSAPNKLFEAIAAGKPILSGDYGELGDIVRQHGCGVLVDTTQPAALLAGLRQIAVSEAYTRMSSAAAGLRALFSRRQAAEALVQLYDSDGQRDGGAQSELESCGRESTLSAGGRMSS